jgi:uncharacterized membrane protein
MAKQARPPRTPLLRQLGIVAFAFLVGQLISTRILPASMGFWLRLLVFLLVYLVAYVALWRLTEGVRGHPVERRRR